MNPPPSNPEPTRSASAAIRVNIAANFASLAFMMVAGVVAMPLWLRLLGAEAYGLVGLYAVLTAGFQIFDAGLSQTFTRECARFRGGALTGGGLRRLFALFERLFLLMAIAGAVAIAAVARPITFGWLHVEQLAPNEVVLALRLMGLAVACQWASGLYRGALIGFERQALLAALAVSFSALRYFGVIAALLAWGPAPSVFFGYQAGIAAVELATLAVICRGLLKQAWDGATTGMSASEWRRVAGFSAGIAFATACWAGLMQGDKLILSKILSLSDYGVFTLVAVAIGAVAGVGAPIGQAILPRLTKLVAEGQEVAAVGLYRRSTQIACLVAFPPALLLSIFARQVLWVWTGDPALAAQAAPILQAYALGSALVAVGAFAYYLQYAHGNLRLHVLGQAVHLLALAPALVVAAARYGATGAGIVWTALNALYVLAWVPVVHRRFAPGLHGRWLLRDVTPIVLATGLVALLLLAAVRWPGDRLGATVWLAIVGAGVFLGGVAASSVARRWISNTLLRLRKR